MSEIWHTFRRIYCPPVCTMFILTWLILMMYIHILLHRRTRRMIRPPGLCRWVACLATWYENVKYFIVGEEWAWCHGTPASSGSTAHYRNDGWFKYYIGGLTLTGKTGIQGEKFATVTFCPTLITHGLPWEWTRVFAEKKRRLTHRAAAWPLHCKLISRLVSNCARWLVGNDETIVQWKFVRSHPCPLPELAEMITNSHARF